jgi:mono/diheme cytochrome c family protein
MRSRSVSLLAACLSLAILPVACKKTPKVAPNVPGAGAPQAPAMGAAGATAPLFALPPGAPPSPGAPPGVTGPTAPVRDPKMVRDYAMGTAQAKAASPLPPEVLRAMGNTPSGGGDGDGKKFFTQACATCHGLDGTGASMRQMMPTIGDLTSADMHARMTDDQIAEQIRNGRNKMPPLGSVLSPEQVRAVVGYVRTLKR